MRRQKFHKMRRCYFHIPKDRALQLDFSVFSIINRFHFRFMTNSNYADFSIFIFRKTSELAEWIS